MEPDITKIAGLARMGLDDSQIAQVLTVMRPRGERTASAPQSTHPETPGLPFNEPRDPLALEPTRLRVTLLRSLNTRPMTSTDLGVVMYGAATPSNTKRVVDVAYALRLRGLVQSDWHGGFARHLYQITDKGRAWLAKAEREVTPAK